MNWMQNMNSMKISSIGKDFVKFIWRVKATLLSRALTSTLALRMLQYTVKRCWVLSETSDHNIQG